MTDQKNTPARDTAHPFRDDSLEALRCIAWHATPFTSEDAEHFRRIGGSVGGEERGERPEDPIVAALDDAVTGFVEAVTRYRSDGSLVPTSPDDAPKTPEDCCALTYREARDATIELVRAVLVAALDESGVGARRDAEPENVAAGATAPPAPARRKGFLERLLGWAVDTAVTRAPGYDVQLIEQPAHAAAGRWMIEPQRRALLVDWLAARYPGIASVDRVALIDLVLASVTAAPGPAAPAPVVVGNEGFGRCPHCGERDTSPMALGARGCRDCGRMYTVTCVGGSTPGDGAGAPSAPPSSHGAGLDAAAARLAGVITGFRSDGSSAYLAPEDPEESVEQYGCRRHAEARDGLIELVREALASVMRDVRLLNREVGALRSMVDPLPIADASRQQTTRYKRLRPFMPDATPPAVGQLKVRVEVGAPTGSNRTSSVVAFDAKGRQWLLQGVRFEEWEIPREVRDGKVVRTGQPFARLIAEAPLVEELIPVDEPVDPLRGEVPAAPAPAHAGVHVTAPEATAPAAGSCHDDALAEAAENYVFENGVLVSLLPHVEDLVRAAVPLARNLAEAPLDPSAAASRLAGPILSCLLEVVDAAQNHDRAISQAYEARLKEKYGIDVSQLPFPNGEGPDPLPDVKRILLLGSRFAGSCYVDSAGHLYHPDDPRVLAMLSARAREATGEEERLRGIFRERAEQVGLDGAEVSR
ncbi:hypothetical protein WMF20_35495 [Sorangium sp. So ce834]|uniref:hypothetical protein n=1 Tax=Sorangium sp. So ce834 TaxID=3133321 RepID=UPI003F61F6B1